MLSVGESIEAECRLQVNLRHADDRRRCLLLEVKQTSIRGAGTSALCQKLPYVTSQHYQIMRTDFGTPEDGSLFWVQSPSPLVLVWESAGALTV